MKHAEKVGEHWQITPTLLCDPGAATPVQEPTWARMLLLFCSTTYTQSFWSRHSRSIFDIIRRQILRAEHGQGRVDAQKGHVVELALPPSP